MMLPASHEWIRASFGPRVFAGLDGLGLTPAQEAARADAISVLGGSRSATATAADKAAAYETYYGKGGFYSQAPSVIAAAAYETGGSMAAPPSEMPAPMLYPAAVCGAAETQSTDCVAGNAQVQRANLAILENARRAFNLQHCEYNAALTPGTGQDVSCAQFRVRVTEPAAPGQKQTAVCSGGECYTPIAGSVAANEQLAQRQFAAQYTPQGTPRVPNQTVPPRPQPGEVPAGDGGAGGEKPPADTGLPFGLTANTLLIGGAVLAAILLLKGKG